MATDVLLNPDHPEEAPRGTDLPAQLLEVEELVVGYGSRPVLGPLSFELPSGSFLLIEGPNGAGKSTLLKTLIGLNPALSGQFRWAVEPHALRFVPQTRTLDSLLPATVDDVMATGLQRGRGWRLFRVREEGNELCRALELVGMAGKGRRLFRELSEGQKQLVLVARALLGEPRVLLLDEPSASMDPEREARTIDLLERVRDELGIAIVMIAHGSQRAREAADQLMTIDRNGGVDVAPADSGAATPAAMH